MPPLPSPAPNECIIALVRHGATDNNLARPPLIQGRRLDPPLSREGLREADCLARALASGRLDAVYTSPLRRARQTAETVAAAHDLAIECVEALIEADVGRWEGRSWDDVRRAEPEDFARFEDDPARWPYAGGENLAQVAGRALPAIRALAERRSGGSIAVVAHNVVNRVVLAEALGIPLTFARRIPQSNAGLSILRTAEGKLLAVSINVVSHLHPSGGV